MHPVHISQWWICGLAVLARLAIGLSSYSGAHDGPTFGDYEAQRHWMEIALALPTATWYTDSKHNNMAYWPLDYPPLSGYQSWLCGKVLEFLEPAAVALGSSRGYESASSKRIMRLTVLVSDLIVFIPACLAAANLLLRRFPPATRNLALAAMLLQPASLLIDHGHFQYNGISLGLAAAAAVAICESAPLLGSVLFCLSLNHKQMALFYAPAFFAHLLGWALQKKGLARKVMALVHLGLVVVATFVVCWAPFLSQPGGVLQVLHRIFPVKRGLYQDYLSNFWCATSLVVKWKQLFEAPLLLRMCSAATLAACAPAMLQQMRYPSRRGLLLCMANCSFAAYMFGYQVHEKSILLPLLPVMMLAPWEPRLATWLPLIASFSMYPLLERDGLTLTYFACCLLYLAFAWPGFAQLATAADSTTTTAPSGGKNGAVSGGPVSADTSAARSSSSGKGRSPLIAAAIAVLRAGQALCDRWSMWISVGSLSVGLALHVARVLVPPPSGLPWLHDRLFVTAAFLALCPCVVWLQVQQWQTGPDLDKLDLSVEFDDAGEAAGAGHALPGGDGGGLKSRFSHQVGAGMREKDVKASSGQRRRKAE